MKRMNIVFAFADDWGKYASAYAPFEGADSINSLISTPNFDRIAREGAVSACVRARALLYALQELRALRPVFLANRPGRRA